MPLAAEDPATVDQLAEAFFAAFVRRDASTLEELYAPDFVMRSPAGVRRGVDHLEMLRAGKVSVRDLRYEDVVRHVFDGGFVQQHHVCGVLPSGRDLRMRACLVVLVVDGRFTELDEYYDPAPLLDEPMYQEIVSSTRPGPEPA